MTPTVVRERLEQQSALLRLTIHELRRPLGVVDGWLSMIQDGSLGPAQLQAPGHAEEALAAMNRAVHEMAALIDGLALVVRHEDQVNALRRRPYRLRHVIASAVAAVEHEARNRQITIDQDGPEVEADVDPEHLRIALVNLAANAIRHSPVGSTVVIAHRPERTAVTIAVSDDGPGISPVEAERIFDPWYQGNGAPAGLGLGLWIASRIVDWHRGRLTLESRVGHGATFVIILPRDGSLPDG